MTAASWYSCSLQPVQRSLGRSAVAATAYACAMSIKDVTTGELYDYSRKRGVLSAETVMPDGIDAPAWADDPAQLANRMEAADNRVNSQPATSIILAMPAAVSPEAREAIARELAQDTANRYGLAAIVAQHEPGPEGDSRNFHAHFLLSTREFGEDGFGKKCRAFSSPPGRPNPEVTWFRKHAAELINDALSDAGSDERVDWRSLEAQGIERVPTRHLGPTASAMEREGKRSDRGDRQREIAEANKRIEANNRLVAELEAENERIIADEERRLNQRFGRLEPESYQREFARQFGQIPELTPDIEQDLAARFGDEQPTGKPDLAHHREDAQGLSAAETAPGMQPLAEEEPLPAAHGETSADRTESPEGPPQRISVWGYAWRGFADRARAFSERLHDLWRDERGEPGEQEDSGLGWTARLRMAKDALTVIFSRGENRRAAAEFAHDAGEELGHIAHDLVAAAQAPAPDPNQDPKSGRAWREMEEERQQERAREPDEQAPERPSDAIDAAFDAVADDFRPEPGADTPEEPEPGPEPDGPDLG